MIRTLQYHGIHQGIDVYMECKVERLMKDGDRISGAFGYWRDTGKFVLFKAKAVVLATGGIGKAWKSPRTLGVHGRWAVTALWAGPISSTWNSCSSIRPTWCGHRRSRVSW